MTQVGSADMGVPYCRFFAAALIVKSKVEVSQIQSSEVHECVGDVFYAS